MVVLDTHVLVWWVSESVRLSASARKAILRAEKKPGQVLISAISAWEIAMLVREQRIELAVSLDDWLAAVESVESVRIVPVSLQVAVQSVRLPGDFHKDPADRMIVALAREVNAPLITADSKIRAYPHIRCIW